MWGPSGPWGCLSTGKALAMSVSHACRCTEVQVATQDAACR